MHIIIGCGSADKVHGETHGVYIYNIILHVGIGSI